MQSDHLKLAATALVGVGVIVAADYGLRRWKAWKAPIEGLPLIPGAHWLLGHVDLFVG